MTVTASSFKTRFTEFAAVADESIEPLLEEALLMHNETAWGNKLDMGVSYYAAHLLQLDIQRAAAGAGSAAVAAGPLQKEKVGPLERTFAVTTFARSFTSQDAGMSSTPYGMHWQLVLRPSIFADRVIISD